MSPFRDPTLTAVVSLFLWAFTLVSAGLAVVLGVMAVRRG